MPVSAGAVPVVAVGAGLGGVGVEGWAADVTGVPCMGPAGLRGAGVAVGVGVVGRGLFVCAEAARTVLSRIARESWAVTEVFITSTCY
jgi:hypothetical protein